MGIQKPMDSDGTRLPPGLPPTKSEDSSKRWKSTRREPQNFQLMKGSGISAGAGGVKRNGSNNKLRAMKESQGGGKYTPNNILNFSRQLNAAGQPMTQPPRDDESPSIKSQPHIERLDSHTAGIG